MCVYNVDEIDGWCMCAVYIIIKISEMKAFEVIRPFQPLIVARGAIPPPNWVQKLFCQN